MGKAFNLKVLTQTLLSITLVSFIIFFATWSYNEAKDELVKTYSNYTLSVAKNNANKIEEHFKELTRLFEYLSNSLMEYGINQEVLTNPYFTEGYSVLAEEFVILDEKGDILFSDSSTFTEYAELRSIFLEVMEEEKGLPTPRLTEYKTLHIKNKRLGIFLFFNRMFYAPENRNIYLSFIISSDRLLKSYINPLNLANSGYGYIMDDDHIIVASGEKSHIGMTFDEIEEQELTDLLEQNRDASVEKIKQIRDIHKTHREEKLEIFQKMSMGDSGTYRYAEKTRESDYELLSFYPIEIPGDTWSFAVKTPHTYIIKTLRGSFWRTVILTGLFGCILFFDFLYVIYNYKKRTLAEIEVNQITNLLEREQDLREAEFKYKQLFQGTKDIILICSSDYLIEEINGAGIDFLNNNISKVVHKVKFQGKFINYNDFNEFTDILNSSGSVVNFQTEVISGDSIKYLDISADKHYDEKAKRQHLYFVIRDMTASKKLQSEIIKKEKLQSAMALIVTANHEINNPLAGIVLSTELIEALLNESDISQESIDKIKHNSKDISKNAYRIADVLTKLRALEVVKEKSYANITQMLDLDSSDDENYH